MPRVDRPPPVKAAELDAPRGSLALSLFDLDHLDPAYVGMVLQGKVSGGGVARPDPDDPKQAAAVLNCELLTACIAADLLRSELRRECGEAKALRCWIKRDGWVRLPNFRPLSLTVEGEVALNPALFEPELPVKPAVPPPFSGPVKLRRSQF